MRSEDKDLNTKPSDWKHLAPSGLFVMFAGIMVAFLILGSPYLFPNHELIQRFIAGPGGGYVWFWFLVWAGIMALAGHYLEKWGWIRIYKD